MAKAPVGSRKTRRDGVYVKMASGEWRRLPTPKAAAGVLKAGAPSKPVPHRRSDTPKAQASKREAWSRGDLRKVRAQKRPEKQTSHTRVKKARVAGMPKPRETGASQESQGIQAASITIEGVISPNGEPMVAVKPASSPKKDKFRRWADKSKS